MEKDYRERNRRSYTIMRMTYDLTMAALILAVAVVMLFGDKMNIQFVQDLDPLIKYLFGGLSVLYGGFRLYRGIKRDY